MGFLEQKWCGKRLEMVAMRYERVLQRNGALQKAALWYPWRPFEGLLLETVQHARLDWMETSLAWMTARHGYRIVHLVLSTDA